MKKIYAVSLVIFACFCFSPVGMSQDETPPLPPHGIEGYGGIFATYSAYLVNQAKNDEIFGLPSVAFTYVNFGHSRDLNAFTITETLWDRVELGYAYDRFDSGDLGGDIFRVTGMNMSDDVVELHNFNARVALFKENDFDTNWVPAVTLGVHYKYNDTVNSIDRDLNQTLTNIGIEDNDGVDITLYASKMIPIMEHPILFNLGLRGSEAAHIGLLGFTGDYEVTVEGSVIAFITDKIIFGGEYRMKPNEYQPVGDLVGEEDDWWTLCLGYIVNEHLCIDAGYGHFGRILNHEANGSWGLRVKWEF